jgi:hypothetical protein
MGESIANRQTVSKRIPEIDSLYVYDTRHIAKMTHRHQVGEGYRYLNKKAIMKAAEGEIHIYHRTATIRGVTNGITMVTKNSKVSDVTKWFKEQVEAIENNDNLFALFSAAKPTPSELGLFYFY